MEGARKLGFLGPGPVGRHVQHAHGFSRVLAAAWRSPAGPGPDGGDRGHEAATPGASPVTPGSLRLVDLGSGGGVPGLVVATDLAEAQVVLLEVNGRRAAFLADVVAHCELEGRVEVLRARAEDVGRDDDRRGRFDAVLARSFGPPGVTAECGAPLLRPGGVLVVSEPPESRGGAAPGRRGPMGPPVGNAGLDEREGGGRWPTDGLAQLGMVRGATVHDEFTYQLVVQRTACPARYPRRTGVPAKRPLF